MSRRNRRFLLRSLYVLLVGSCTLPLLAQTAATGGGAQPASANATVEPQSPRLLANSNLKLGVGDLIEISVFGVPDLSTKARISGSGDVYLPLIDYVHLASLTTDEAQELIQKRLEAGGFVRRRRLRRLPGNWRLGHKTEAAGSDKQHVQASQKEAAIPPEHTKTPGFTRGSSLAHETQ